MHTIFGEFIYIYIYMHICECVDECRMLYSYIWFSCMEYDEQIGYNHSLIICLVVLYIHSQYDECECGVRLFLHWRFLNVQPRLRESIICMCICVQTNNVVWAKCRDTMWMVVVCFCLSSMWTASPRQHLYISVSRYVLVELIIYHKHCLHQMQCAFLAASIPHTYTHQHTRTNISTSHVITNLTRDLFQNTPTPFINKQKSSQTNKHI